MTNKWSGASIELGGWLLRWRWQLAGLLSIIAVAVELAEHQPELLYHVDLVIFAVIVPCLVGVVLSGLERAQSRTVQARKDAATEERRHLARDLHDSLGQQLAYLQLKLEQLTAEDADSDIACIRQEMQNMRSVVTEAYSLVRSTLFTLDASVQSDLTASLQELAERVATRAGFKVSFASRGRCTPLSPHTQRQVVFIIREALANVERHAGARRVTIKLIWSVDSILIDLADDGVGFEPGATSQSDHLGLTLIQERADEIGAQLLVSSQPGRGTRLQLSLLLNNVTPIHARTPTADEPAA